MIKRNIRRDTQHFFYYEKMTNITKIKKDEKNILHTGNHSIFDTDSKL